MEPDLSDDLDAKRLRSMDEALAADSKAFLTCQRQLGCFANFPPLAGCARAGSKYGTAQNPHMANGLAKKP